MKSRFTEVREARDWFAPGTPIRLELNGTLDLIKPELLDSNRYMLEIAGGNNYGLLVAYVSRENESQGAMQFYPWHKIDAIYFQ